MGVGKTTHEISPKSQLVDEAGNLISAANPLDVTVAGGIANDAWVHSGTGVAINSTTEGVGEALDTHLTNASIEQTTGAAHNDLNLAIGGKDESGNVQPPLIDASTRRTKTSSDLEALTGIGNGQKTVTSAGTAEALASATTIRSVTIKALADNTGNVYVGDSGVTSSNGFVLAAGETVSLDFDELNDIYIDVDTNGEGVSFIYLT